MRIAILSDIHDNIWALERVLNGAKEADVLIFCGDLCAPFTLKMIGDGFAGPIHCVTGNNDGDMLLIARNAAQSGNVTLHGPFAELELGGKRVFVNHYPPIAAAAAASGKYDLVCCGHDHRPAIEQVEQTVLVNPGEVMGRYGRSTYAMYDTETGVAELRTV